MLPPLRVNVPSTTVPVPNSKAPVVSVRLLNVVILEPFTVPAFEKITAPVPRVNVPLLVNDPPPDMVKFPAAVQLSVLLFTTKGAEIEPVAPNVRSPLLVIEVVGVKEPAALLTFKVEGEFIVTVVGEFTIAEEMFKSLSMVTTAPVGGTTPPNQEDAVAQADAPD